MKIFIKLAIFLIAFIFLTAKSTLAADFILSPESKILNVGEEFQLQINLDTKGKEVNGVQASVNFCTSCLEVRSISFSGIFPSNFQSFDNVAGLAQVGSGQDLPTASYNGSSLWTTITFRAKAEGNGTVSIDPFNSAILELNTSADLFNRTSLRTVSIAVGQSQTNPTPTPTSGSNQNGNQGTTTTSCNETSPSTPTNLKAESGPNNGEVTLTWTKVYQANHYSLVFGPSSKNYVYGAADIGNVNNYVVKSLTPGKLYYFAIAGVGNCSSSGFSQEVSARAKGTTTTAAMVTTTKSKITPTPEKVNYKPISEAFPNLVVATPTPIEIASVAQAPAKNESGLFMGIGILFAAIFLTTGFFIFLYRRLRPPSKPPTIMNITSDTPIEPPLNPT